MILLLKCWVKGHIVWPELQEQVEFGMYYDTWVCPRCGKLVEKMP